MSAESPVEITLVESLAAGDERGAEATLERLMGDGEPLARLLRLLVALRGDAGDRVPADLRAEWAALARELAGRVDMSVDARLGALEAREVSARSALREVLAHPDDDAPRLAYGALLSRRGDPRGEFIAVQCALARGVDDPSHASALQAREAELLKAHEAAWRMWLCGALGTELGCTWRRGFAESVELSAEAFPGVAEALFALEPVVGVGLWDVTARAMPRLATVAQLARVRALDLSFNHRDARARALGARGAKALFASSYLSSLRSLNLRDQRIGDEGAASLARCESLGALTSLNLSANALTAVGAASLASCARLSGLRQLDLVDNAVGDEGAASLASSPHLRVLSELMLVSNAVGARGATALAESRWDALEGLWLGGNAIGDAGVAALARSGALPSLRVLQLWDVGIGPDGARALAETTLGALREVHVYGNAIGEPAAEALRARFQGAILPH